MEKVIFVTQRVERIESYNEKRDALDQNIILLLLKCGYTPIPLPNNIDIVKKITTDLRPSGILLTGGNSLVKYGGDAPERDDVDSYLISYALNNSMPLLGICRGMQSILDYFNAPLTNVKNHVAVKHIVKNSKTNLLVNSYHNQGCINMDSGELQVCFSSEDNVIEMIKHKDLPLVGIMWHPEREKPFNNFDIDLIKELFK